MIRSMPHVCRFLPTPLALAALCVAALAIGCRQPSPARAPAIMFTTIPQADEGGADRTAEVSGRVTGARPGQRVVLFARTNVWWVQPLSAEPFTPVAADGTWKSRTHLGREYAALLVQPQYRPPDTAESLPQAGGQVIAVATVTGAGVLAERRPKTLMFSGYEWNVRQIPSERGGLNDYDPANAWTDPEGHLHLEIAQRGGKWTSAEVSLARPLGYGTYLFVVRDVSRLDPVAALGLYTWDDLGAEQNHRELDVEISRWGDPQIKNAQYVVQPYYLAANVARFAAPPGRLTHAFRWQPGQVTFTTVRGDRAAATGPAVFRHDFSTGVPVPGGETTRMVLYYFRHSRAVLRNEVEVVIERFQYLP
jgi:hypothetical protein